MATPTTELQPHALEQGKELSKERIAEFRFEQLDPATVERLRVLSELPVADLAAVGSVRQEVINRLLEGLDPETAASVEQRLARDLETARGLQQQFLEALQQLQAANEISPANEPPVPVEPVVEPVPPQPTIDGVRPPSSQPVPPKIGESIKTDKPEESDDDDSSTYDYDEDKPVAEAATVLAADQVVEQNDPYAERNTASAGLLEQLKQDDYSVPGQSNLVLLKQIREVILQHNNEPLAVRYDTDGNVVIGVPEDGGNGLRTRLVTISHNETGTIEWLQRARPQDYLTLQRHRIAVIEDPQLQHDPQSEALAA